MREKVDTGVKMPYSLKDPKSFVTILIMQEFARGEEDKDKVVSIDENNKRIKTGNEARNWEKVIKKPSYKEEILEIWKTSEAEIEKED